MSATSSVITPALIGAFIDLYKTTENPHSNFGKVILESLKEGEKFWSDKERADFWKKHLATFCEFFPDYLKGKIQFETIPNENDSKEPLIQWKTGCRWPAYYYFQPHSETKAMAMLKNWEDGIQIPQRDMSAFLQSVFTFPPEIGEFKNTLQNMELLFKKKRFCDLTPEQWSKLFSKINGELFGGIAAYRKKESCVVNSELFYAPDQTKEECLANIERKFKDSEDLKKWGTLRQRVLDFIYEGKDTPFTKKETQFLIKHHLMVKTLTKPVDQIPQLMKGFCERLPQILNGTSDIFEIMGLIHQEFVRKIHPFEDRNGRTIRMIINAIGMQAGIDPILIRDSKEYMYACAQENPKVMAEYLRRSYEQQQKELQQIRAPMYNGLLMFLVQTI